MMKPLISFVIKQYIFWFAFFTFFKILFWFSLIPFEQETHFTEIISGIKAGFQLDVSTASYLFVIPFFAIIIRIFFNKKTADLIYKWYSLLIIILMTLLSYSNIIIFKYWGTLLNNRALQYVTQPREMLASVNNLQLILIIGVLVVTIISIIKIFSKLIFPAFRLVEERKKQTVISIILLLPLIGIGIRGGLQLIPVNESSAIYSTHHSLNQAAINPAWYLGHNLSQAGISEKNPFQFMSAESAKEKTKNILRKSPPDSSTIFNLNGKPNVVFILLESYTADIIEPLNGIKNVTPNFTKLASEGLLFTSIYSSGFRTDQALISVLSGFPSQPNQSIIRFPGKASQLPAITSEFKKAGYNNSFYYGGELGFANMNSYLINSGFSNITSISNFASNKQNSKWGAHDEFVLSKQLEDLKTAKQPFFSTLLTLSTHEPFEVPVSTPFNSKSEPELFKKAAWYTDYALGKYFAEAKKQPWYSNTIFVLVADHGHRLPENREYIDPAMRRIPLLIISDLLKTQYKGSTNATQGNQHDIAATVLRNLFMDDSKFEWSVNLFDTNRSNFTYLTLDFAFTWKTDSSTLIIPLQPGLPEPVGNKEQIELAKAYLQQLYQSFTDY